MRLGCFGTRNNHARNSARRSSAQAKYAPYPLFAVCRQSAKSRRTNARSINVLPQLKRIDICVNQLAKLGKRRTERTKIHSDLLLRRTARFAWRTIRVQDFCTRGNAFLRALWAIWKNCAAGRVAPMRMLVTGPKFIVGRHRARVVEW